MNSTLTNRFVPQTNCLNSQNGLVLNSRYIRPDEREVSKMNEHSATPPLASAKLRDMEPKFKGHAFVIIVIVLVMMFLNGSAA